MRFCMAIKLTMHRQQTHIARSLVCNMLLRFSNKRISSSFEHAKAFLDRLRESHWFIHQMVEHYHSADRFRYSLNAFLRSLKEIRPMLQQGMQGVNGFKDWFSVHGESLKT